MDTRSVGKYLGFAGVTESEFAIGVPEVGRLCIAQNAAGDWEVIDLRSGAPQLLQVFATDELACYHLYGVLVESHIAAGTLVRNYD